MGDAVVKPADAEAPAQSFPERLLGVFISPKETFADVARKPGFVAPLITLMIAAVAVTEVMLWKIGAERIVRMSMEQSGQASRMSPEQLDQAVTTAAKITGIAMHVGGVVGVPIYLLILAGLGILIANVIFGAQVKFGTVVSLVCYANLVSLLSSLMALAMMLFGDLEHFNVQNPIPTNPGFFLNVTEVSKPLYAFASSIDIFPIWIMILLGIGLSEGTGRKVKASSIFLVYLGFWALWVLIKIGRAFF
jgi:hypothetical protein